MPPDAWLFDLDNTLYPAASNLFAQVDQRMGRFIADLFGCSQVEAKARQKDYWTRHGTTMRGLMVEHGVDPEAFMAYVHDVDLSVVHPDPRLDAALGALPGRKIVFTNGSVPHAERVLARVGIGHHFEGVFDIVAADYLPKPDPASYAAVVRRFGLDAARTAMVEDMAKNLPPAARLGMTTIWVPPHADAEAGDAAPFIHHRVADLPAFLARFAAAAG